VPRMSLFPAFSRPIQLCRILPMACQLGLDRIVLSNARKLPRDYFGLSLLRKPEMLWGQLVEELTISSNVSLPNVVLTGKLGAFLEDELDGRKRQRRLGGRGGSDKRQAMSMRMHRRNIGHYGPRGATSEEDGLGKNATRSETASSSRRPCRHSHSAAQHQQRCHRRRLQSPQSAPSRDTADWR